MKILSFKVRKDGSADMDYSLNKEEENLLRDKAKKDGVRFSKKFCNKTILEALENLTKEKK